MIGFERYTLHPITVPLLVRTFSIVRLVVATKPYNTTLESSLIIYLFPLVVSNDAVHPFSSHFLQKVFFLRNLRL